MPFRRKIFTEVKPIERHTLLKSLEPVRKLALLCALLPAWCRPNRRRVAANIASTLGIGLFVSISLLMVTFQIFQLVVLRDEVTSLHLVIPLITWLVGYASSLVHQLHYIHRRTETVAFFGDWAQLERRILARSFSRDWHKKKIKILYAIHAVFALTSVLAICVLLVTQADQPPFLSYYSQLRRILTTPVLAIFHLLAMFHLTFFISFSELVPTLTYYCIASTLTSLHHQVQNRFHALLAERTGLSSVSELAPKSRLEQHLICIWCRYEEIHHMVGRANRVFGASMALSHLFFFFIITFLTYEILHNLGSFDWLTLVTYACSACMFALLLVTGVLITDSLPRAFNQFRSGFASLLSQHWPLLLASESQIATTLLSRFEADSLRAAPLDLYAVNRSLLLQMTSITVTYIVILLQTK